MDSAKEQQEALRSLAEAWEKEAAGYMQQAAIIAGSLPGDLTPEQSGSSHAAGAYRTCAHKIHQLIT